MDDGGDDVGGDEDGDDGFAGEAQGAEVRAHVGDQGGEGGVDCGGEEDGGDDDEEVLHDEVDDVVRVADGGWGGLEAEGVADDFADGGEDEEGGEGVEPVGVEPVGVQDEEEGVEGDGEGGEGEGGGVAECGFSFWR